MKQWIGIGVGWAVIIILVTVGLFIFTDIFANSPIPKNVQRNVRFPVVYSRQLPEGYNIDRKSYQLTQGVLTYTIVGPKAIMITVSQQQTPTSFDFEDFHTKSLKHSRTTKTANGDTAYLGTIEKNNVASIRSDTSWVLISAQSSQVSLNTLESLAKTVTD